MMLRRLRYRLGLWLSEPMFAEMQAVSYGHAKNRDEPRSYHPDWWWGHFFGVESLRRALRYGEIHVPAYRVDGGQGDDGGD